MVKVWMIILIISTPCYAGIQFFGPVDSAMATNQTRLNLMAYINDIYLEMHYVKTTNTELYRLFRNIESGSKEYMKYTIIEKNIHDTKQELSFRYLKLLRLDFERLKYICEKSNLKEYAPKFYWAVQDNMEPIERCLAELIDNAMVGSLVESYSIPMKQALYK